MKLRDLKKIWKKIWYFIWEDNSFLSWIVNIILAFILIKFLVFPGLSLFFGTSHPIVAVVSPSMEHDSGFEEWWDKNSDYYSGYGITKDDFSGFVLKNGFNKGDIIILRGAKPGELAAGDIIVFRSPRPDPIIHRVIDVWKEGDYYFFRTKGDNNPESLTAPDLDETRIGQSQLIGRAWLRIPLLGYFKIVFVDYACPLPLINQAGQFLGVCPRGA